MESDAEFTEYVASRWARLVRSAVLLGCAPGEAQDLAQTTLMRCYASWHRVQRADDQDAYVYRMLVNAHHDSRRRRWWGERPTERVPQPPQPDSAELVETADVVSQALAGLSEKHRCVVVLRYYAHLSERQIAEALHIAPGTVKSRLSRALAQLSQDHGLAELEGRSIR